MSFNNTISEKFKFQDLPGVPDNQKVTATEFNQLVDFQKSPVQQISGSLDDTGIVIDGTKNYATTITVAGATRTITASGSGHKQGNNIKQRYTFDVDCTITLSGFDATGNNIRIIDPIRAGTYDFQFLSNKNGINLLIFQNFNTFNKTVYIRVASAGAVSANNNADDLVVENDGDSGITLLTPDANNSQIYFGSPNDNVGAMLRWNRSSETMTLSTRRATGILKLYSGELEGGIDISPNGNVLFTAQATVQGKIVTFTATPTFDLDDGNVQEMILTSNVTSLTLSNKLDAGNYLIYLIQDGTGGHTLPTPDSSWGDPTDNSVDPSNFLTGTNDRNLINVAVSPSGFTEYSIETHNI